MAQRVPRLSAPVVQRLHLTQAGRYIVEDNQTLKAEYIAARDAGNLTDLNAIMTLQSAQAAAWKEENDRRIAEEVLKVVPSLPPLAIVPAPLAIPSTPTPSAPVSLGPGRVKASILNKSPFQGGTAGQRYIRWKGGAEYPHTSISFQIQDKGETARITGLHAAFGKSDTHFWWNHQSPPGTFHLSSQGGAKYQLQDVERFSPSGLQSLARAWTRLEKHAKKVNCVAEKPPGI